MRLPGWNYPVIFQLDTGNVLFDNYNGSWGDIDKLDEFVQRYANNLATSLAQQHGYTVQEEVLDNGDLRLLCNAY